MPTCLQINSPVAVQILEERSPPFHAAKQCEEKVPKQKKKKKGEQRGEERKMKILIRKKTRNTQETQGNGEFFSRAEQSLAASAISLPLQDTDLSRLICRYLGISFATLQEEGRG